MLVYTHICAFMLIYALICVGDGYDRPLSPKGMVPRWSHRGGMRGSLATEGKRDAP